MCIEDVDVKEGEDVDHMGQREKGTKLMLKWQAKCVEVDIKKHLINV